MKNYIIAHDLGTTGNKATLYDREGNLTRWFRATAWFTPIP
jgi:sugar (pentulose or hexulose) kinase